MVAAECLRGGGKRREREGGEETWRGRRGGWSKGEKRECVRACEREWEREGEREREIVAFDLKLLPLSLHLPSSHSFPENASKSEGRLDTISQTCKRSTQWSGLMPLSRASLPTNLLVHELVFRLNHLSQINRHIKKRTEMKKNLPFVRKQLVVNSSLRRT